MLVNLTDSMVPWVRRADGSLAFDFSRLDRYLDMAIEHCGRPKVINFIVMHGTVGDEADVEVLDAATGRTDALRLGNRRAGYEAHWRAFASAVHRHMRDRGLAESMYWGFIWDSVPDAELVRLLASVTPGVWWTAGAHRGKEHFWVRAYSQLLPFQLTAHSRFGWRNPEFHVLLPRGGGSLAAAPGVAFPFSFRLAVDRSLVVGMNGVGRMGADYWSDTYIKGMRQEGWLRAGMPNHFLLWPGPRGAESSARFEALLEGYQETEARIFLEQLLARSALPDALAKTAKDVLFEHHRGTLFIPSMTASHRHVELCRDWQDRSGRLFAVAAHAARAVGLDLDCYRTRWDARAGRTVTACRLAGDVPARGRLVVPLKLRNWTADPRAWKLTADRAWIRPGRASGRSVAHEDVPIELDATDLPPGQVATGTLRVTDVTAGRSQTVQVVARVSKLFEHASPTATLPKKEMAFIPDEGREVIHGTPGRQATRDVSFFHRSARPTAWRATPSLPWLKASPASGTAGPGERVTVRVTAEPGAKDAGVHEAALTISEAGGSVREDIPLAVYALPEYRPPALPDGSGLLVDEELFAALKPAQRAWRPRWCAHALGGFVMTPGRTERGRSVGNLFTLTAPYEVTFSLAGRDVRAMSVLVDLPDPRTYPGYKYWDAGHEPPPEWIRVRFEVYVDGRLGAASGWMDVRSDPQVLVVRELRSAKRMRWVTRFEKYPPAAVTAAWWDIRFYR